MVLTVMLFSIVESNRVFAQDLMTSDKNNYFVLTRNTEQLNPIILAAKELALQNPEKYGSFHVVICGKAVTDLVNKEKMKPFLELAKQTNVKMFACGFSLKKFKVDKQKLPQGFGVVENGILYGFELQKSGFYSISL